MSPFTILKRIWVSLATSAVIMATNGEEAWADSPITATLVASTPQSSLANKQPNPSFSANPAGTSYQTAAYSPFPAITAASWGTLARDASGNLYLAPSGQSRVVQIKPDGSVGLQWSGLSTPDSLVMAKDGNSVIVDTANGLMRLSLDGTSTLLNTNTKLKFLQYSPSGQLYGVDYFSGNIYQIDDTGHDSVYLAGGSIAGPLGFTFNAAGDMLVTSFDSLAIYLVKQDKTVQQLVSFASSGIKPLSLIQFGQGWILGGYSGVYFLDAQWHATQLTGDRADQLLKLADGSVTFVAPNVGPRQLLATPTTATINQNNLSNATLIAPANLTLTATVTDTASSITRVEFFNGSTSLGVLTQAPYTLDLNNVTPGSYSIVATVTDSLGNNTTSAASNLTILANISPSLTLLSPVATQGTGPVTDTPLSAYAFDSDGDIAKVEFFADNVSMGAVAQAPYVLNWANLTPGSHSITVKATDNLGASTVSSAVAVTIAGNALPSVTLTSPTDGQRFTPPANVTLSAAASDSDGTISQVAFFNGSNLLGTVTQAPYTITLSSVAAGSYSITASATDNRGGVSTTSPVSIVVDTPPAVTLVASPNTATAPAILALTANVRDTYGSIAQVEFFNGVTSLGIVTQPPFSFNWTNVAAGTYTLFVKATDILGGTTTSSAVTVVVNANSGTGTSGPEQVYYIQADHLNTPRILTDKDNGVVWQWGQDEPFGATVANQDPANSGKQTEFNLRFPGQYFDKETNTHYNYFRDYDPQTGRYLQSDPIGLDGGINTYGYVEGNATTASDPTGLNPVLAVYRAGRIGWNIGEAINPTVQPWIASALDSLFPMQAAYGPMPARTPAQEKQADAEHDAYKRVCEGPPPPGLDKCAEAKWERDRAQQCMNMRQDWDNKWWPGRHAQEIANQLNRYKKWAKVVANCTCP